MTKEERHSAILDSLLKQGSVLVTDLASSLEVSSVTIRKDLTELEKEGKLYRSHGKAYSYQSFYKQPHCQRKGEVQHGGETAHRYRSRQTHHTRRLHRLSFGHNDSCLGKEPAPHEPLDSGHRFLAGGRSIGTA